MTRFHEKRFTGPPGTARPDECRRVGHTQPDYHGRCYRCGVRVETPSQAMRDRAEREGATIVEGSATLTISQEAIDACQPRRGAFADLTRELERLEHEREELEDPTRGIITGITAAE